MDVNDRAAQFVYRWLDRGGPMRDFLKRCYIAWHLGEWPPSEVAQIGLSKPPDDVFRMFRRLHGIVDERDER